MVSLLSWVGHMHLTSRAERFYLNLRGSQFNITGGPG